MFRLPRKMGILLLLIVIGVALASLPLQTLHAGMLDWLFGETEKSKTKRSDDPSKEDLIQAVRNHVSGKTYRKPSFETRRRSRTCSQMDVDRDPHAKRNPELARCPHVGATYWVNERVSVQKRHTCPQPPGPSQGWSVQKLSSKQWRVSNSGSSWNLTHLRSESREVDVIHLQIEGKMNTFRIDAHQDC